MLFRWTSSGSRLLRIVGDHRLGNNRLLVLLILCFTLSLTITWCIVSVDFVPQTYHPWFTPFSRQENDLTLTVSAHCYENGMRTYEVCACRVRVEAQTLERFHVLHCLAIAGEDNSCAGSCRRCCDHRHLSLYLTHALQERFKPRLVHAYTGDGVLVSKRILLPTLASSLPCQLGGVYHLLNHRVIFHTVQSRVASEHLLSLPAQSAFSCASSKGNVL